MRPPALQWALQPFNLAALGSRGKLLAPWRGDKKEDLSAFWTGFWHRASMGAGALPAASSSVSGGRSNVPLQLIQPRPARLRGTLEGESNLLPLALVPYLEKLGLLCLGNARRVLLLHQLGVHFSQGRAFLEAELVDAPLGPA